MYLDRMGSYESPHPQPSQFPLYLFINHTFDVSKIFLSFVTYQIHREKTSNVKIRKILKLTLNLAFKIFKSNNNSYFAKILKLNFQSFISSF